MDSWPDRNILQCILFGVKLQARHNTLTGYAFSFLNCSPNNAVYWRTKKISVSFLNVRICHLSLSPMTVKEESPGFGLLVGQKKHQDVMSAVKRLCKPQICMSLVFAPDVGISPSHYMVIRGLSHQKVDGEGGGFITTYRAAKRGDSSSRVQVCRDILDHLQAFSKVF